MLILGKTGSIMCTGFILFIPTYTFPCMNHWLSNEV